MDSTTLPASTQRIGFYYYPDCAHFRRIDLETWLPELKRMGAAWLALVAPSTRAIPEDFISGLIAGGIQPVLHFRFTCGNCGDEVVDGCATPPPPADTLRLLLGSYARWGVKYAVFFDRPNCRSAWPSTDWLQGDLVERFLDRFLPPAEMALEAGLTPVFPPLAPGGDYWDLSFLRSALRGLRRRGSAGLLESLVLSAEAWVGEHALDWGAGGPERWPGARAYYTPPGAQDAAGFRIFDWYLAAAREELGHALPVILLRAGQLNTGIVCSDPDVGPAATEDATAGGASLAASIRHARQNQAIARLLDEPAEAPGMRESEPIDPEMVTAASYSGEAGAIPAEVLACCFWLLTAERGHPAETEAWFPPAGQVLPVVGAFHQWREARFPAQPPLDPDPGPEAEAAPGEAKESPASPEPAPEGGVVTASEPEAGVEADKAETQTSAAAAATKAAAFDHYLLLPLYAWGAANWDLTLIQPILQSAHPTIGFSLAEARLARRVTVVGDSGAVSSEALAMLRRSGCQVERLLEDGTLVAT